MATMPLARPRWSRARAAWLAVLGHTATAAGTAVRLMRGRSRSYPGIAGAVLVSICAGGVVGHTVGYGLTPWVAGLIGGGWLVLIGREINQVPPPPEPPEYQ